MNKVCLQIDLHLEIYHFLFRLRKKAPHLSIISRPFLKPNPFFKTAKF
jgi:hypothetical protein